MTNTADCQRICIAIKECDLYKLENGSCTFHTVKEVWPRLTYSIGYKSELGFQHYEAKLDPKMQPIEPIANVKQTFNDAECQELCEGLSECALFYITVTARIRYSYYAGNLVEVDWATCSLYGSDVLERTERHAVGIRLRKTTSSRDN